MSSTVSLLAAEAVLTFRLMEPARATAAGLGSGVVPLQGTEPTQEGGGVSEAGETWVPVRKVSTRHGACMLAGVPALCGCLRVSMCACVGMCVGVIR